MAQAVPLRTVLPSDVGLAAVTSRCDIGVLERRVKMAALAQVGATPSQAAAALGTSRASVTRMEKATGVTFRRDEKTGLKPLEGAVEAALQAGALLVDPDHLRERAMDMKPLDAVDFLLGIVEGLTHRLPEMTLEPFPGLLLSKMEARLLHHLDLRDGKPCTKEALMAALYHSEPGDWPEVKIIDVFVCNLRKKLKGTPFTIHTIWGVGYRLEGASGDNFRLDWRT
jgi:two-component system cell cycle response regulator CtrA